MYEMFIVIFLIAVILVDKYKQIATICFITGAILYFLYELTWIDLMKYRLSIALITVLIGYCIYGDVMNNKDE